MKHNKHPRNVTAYEIRNDETVITHVDLLSKKYTIDIVEKNPLNNKTLRFKAVIVYGSCCWIFHKKKHGGPNFTTSAPGTYSYEWAIKKVGVNNCYSNSVKTDCDEMGCDKSTERYIDPNTYDNDHQLTTLKPDLSIASIINTEKDLTTTKSTEKDIIDKTVAVEETEYITNTSENHSATTESSKTSVADHAKISDSSKRITHNSYLMMITFICLSKEIFVL